MERLSREIQEECFSHRIICRRYQMNATIPILRLEKRHIAFAEVHISHIQKIKTEQEKQDALLELKKFIEVSKPIRACFAAECIGPAETRPTW